MTEQSSHARPSIESLSNKPDEAKYFHHYLTDEERTIIRDLAQKKGFTELTETQHDALLNGVMDDNNHLLIAQTGNGKTFVAETIALKQLRNYGTVAYLVPSKRLQKEKLESIREWAPDDVTVGGRGEKYKEADILVKTFDSYFTALIQGVPAALNFDVAIFDDFHDLYDNRNGSKIEKAIAMSRYYDIPIFALSATIGNPKDIAFWMNGDVTESDEPRCNPLREHPVDTDESDHGTIKETITATIAARTDQAPFLIFNNSRKRTQNRAEELAKEGVFNNHVTDEDKRRFETKVNELLAGDLTDQAKSLIKCMQNGVAFHHSGVPNKLRSFVIDEFTNNNKNTIQAVFCTPTLAYGFDAAIQSIIIGSLTRYDHSKRASLPIKPHEYIQWIGRAARKNKGYDEGHVYIMYNDEQLLEKYQPGVQPRNKELPPISSSFGTNDTATRRTFLQLIQAGWTTEDELHEFLKETLLHYYLREDPDRISDSAFSNVSNPEQAITSLANRTIRWLARYNFITQDPTTKEWSTTNLGEATVYFYAHTWKDIEVEKLNRLWHAFDNCPELTKDQLLYRIASTFRDDGQLDIDVEEDPDETLQTVIDQLSIDPLPTVDSASATTTFLLYEWCRGITAKRMDQRFNTNKSAVTHTADFHSDVLFAMSQLVEKHPDITKPDWYETFITQIEHGIHEQLLPLMEIDLVGRRTAVNIDSYLEDLAGQPVDMVEWERTGDGVKTDLRSVAANEFNYDYEDFAVNLVEKVDNVGEKTAGNIIEAIHTTDGDDDSPPGNQSILDVLEKAGIDPYDSDNDKPESVEFNSASNLTTETNTEQTATETSSTQSSLLDY